VWHPLGYIYDTSVIESDKEKHQQGIDLKTVRTHKIYTKVLESYVAAQCNKSLNNIILNIGGISKKVDIKVPCMFIIGDIQGGDKICCASATYSTKVSRICHKCDVSEAMLAIPK